jgi:hypothetical protein
VAAEVILHPLEDQADQAEVQEIMPQLPVLALLGKEIMAEMVELLVNSVVEAEAALGLLEWQGVVQMVEMEVLD